MKVICVLLMTWLTSTAAQASEVGLIVWIDDGRAVGMKSLEQVATDVEMHIPEAIVLNSSKARIAQDIASLASQFDAGDKISSLVIGTHGDTCRKGKTHLRGLGGFGPQGSFGELRHLLDKLGERKLLTTHLNLYLDSCATFADSDKSVVERSRALHHELQRYGVETLRIWGAQQPLLPARYRGLSLAEAVLNVQKQLAPYYAIVAGPLVVTLAYYFTVHGFGAQSLTFAKRAFGVIGILAGPGLAFGNLLQVVQYLGAGTKGSLVEVSPTSAQIQQVDLKDSLPRTLHSCEVFTSKEEALL